MTRGWVLRLGLGILFNTATWIGIAYYESSQPEAGARNIEL